MHESRTGRADHARNAVSGGVRVLVVTAAMGAGHTQVAAEFARRLALRGARPQIVDLIEDGGATGRRLRTTYRFLLRRAPWVYDAAMRFWARVPGPLEALTAAGGRHFERVLHEAVVRFRADVVVSTYDLASQALGRLVRDGSVTVPVVTYVSDPGAHPYWVSAHVTRHLVLTELTAHRLRHYGARGVQVVRPVLRPEFESPPPRAAARRRTGLPAGRRIALVTAGSWAVGGIETTVRRLTADPGLTVVVLCGHDERLRARLDREPGVVAVPWTSRTVEHLAAADVVIDNAGGLTCWEALACRTPVLLYRPLPGHGRFNVTALDKSGLARRVERADQLLPAITAAAGTAGARPDQHPAEDAVDCVLAVAAGAGRAAVRSGAS